MAHLARFRRDLAFAVVGSGVGLALSVAIAAHANGAPAAGSVAAAASMVSPPSSAQPHLGHDEEHEHALERHRAEPLDPSWAVPTAHDIREALEPIASRGAMTVDAVDCRSTSCTADLRWGSYGAAMAGYRVITQARIPEACGRAIRLPPPADVTAPYVATAVFDCAKDRTK